MISANHRPDYCRDVSRNRDSVIISDEITDSLISLLKVSCKNITFISMESLYIASQKIKRGENKATHAFITNSYLLKVYDGLPSAGNWYGVRSRMNEVSQESRNFCFQKIQVLVSDDTHVVVQVFARFGKISGLVWSCHGYFGSIYGKPWLDQTRPAIFPNREKPARLHISMLAWLTMEACAKVYAGM